MFAKNCHVYLVFFVIFVLVSSECKPLKFEVGMACVVQHLKDNNKLEKDFPFPDGVDTSDCQIIMPLLMRVSEDMLRLKLSRKESIKADCVMVEMKKSDGLDYIFIHDVVQWSKGSIEADDIKKYEKFDKTLKEIFENAAIICESDPSYGGLLDEVVKIKNESLPVLQQNYCFTKYAIESKLIDVEDVDYNPKKIDTSIVDCTVMIKNKKVEKEEKLLDVLRTLKLAPEKIQCVVENFQMDRNFDWNLAFQVIEQLEIPTEVRIRNGEIIAQNLKNLSRSMFVCIEIPVVEYEKFKESR